MSGFTYDGKLSIDNHDVAQVFERIADLLEIKDENPFKVRSYRLAAETIEGLRDSVAELAARGANELQKIPGIGKSISAQIIEIVKTGTSAYFETLKGEIPETVLDLRRVSGIGPKTAQALYRDFGIKSLEDLKAFAEGGGLMSVPGLGEKMADRILRSLARIESERGRMRLSDAMALSDSIAERLKGVDNRIRVETVGQIRRGCEVIDVIELLATGDVNALSRALLSCPQTGQTKIVRQDRVETQTSTGTPIVLHIASDGEYAVAMVRTTGSIEHVRDIEAEAERLGLRFKGFKLARSESRSQLRSLPIKSEEDFYRALNLQFIPPEIREGLGEVEAAREGRLPQLITLEDVRGDFHVHTTWSDGRASVREMIEAARAMGYQYIAITDHTKSSAVANGNKPEELLEEIEEIEAVAREFNDIIVLKGAEVDILSDGSLDMPFEVLDSLDWIIGSIHSGFHQDQQQITDRVIRAMQTGYPNVIAHPTGRILGERAPYAIDLERVIAAAKQYNVRLELNASPYRLDLDSYWSRVAKQAGVGIVINSDSHQVRGLSEMRYGVIIARRAMLTPNDVLNTLPPEALLAELERKKSMRGHLH
jgi:DNA polymerase (family 10)